MERKEYVRECLYGIYYYRDPEMTVQHRERVLPACEYFGESKSYLENNQYHRLDGVSKDWKDYKGHLLNGKKLFTKK